MIILESQRDERIDILKGIAIFLVVLGHINAPEKLTDFIYSFHMPLFMFLSGCTFWYSLKKRYVEDKLPWKQTFSYIGKRFLPLVIPYVVWAWIWEMVIHRNYNPITAMTRGFSVYWYLPTLFGIIAIVSLAEALTVRICHAKKWIYSLITEAIFAGMLILPIIGLALLTHIKLFREIIIYIIPFFAGMVVKKYPQISKLVTNEIMVTICFLVSCMLIPQYTRSDKSLEVLFIRFIAGMTSTEVIYSFIYSVKITQGGVNSTLEKLIDVFKCAGRRSLEIYLISELFTPLLPATPNIGIFPDTLLRILYSAVICLCSILIANLSQQSKYLNFMFFGGRRIVKK